MYLYNPLEFKYCVGQFSLWSDSHAIVFLLGNDFIASENEWAGTSELCLLMDYNLPTVMSKQIWDLWQQLVIALLCSSVAAMNPARHNLIPRFAHISLVYTIVCGKLSWARGILAGIIELVLHVSLPMALECISPLSGRKSCTPFYQKMDRKGVFTLSILEATYSLAQMIAIIFTKPTIKVFWWHFHKNKTNVLSVGLDTTFK